MKVIRCTVTLIILQIMFLCKYGQIISSCLSPIQILGSIVFFSQNSIFIIKLLCKSRIDITGLHATG